MSEKNRPGVGGEDSQEKAEKKRGRLRRFLFGDSFEESWHQSQAGGDYENEHKKETRLSDEPESKERRVESFFERLLSFSGLIRREESKERPEEPVSEQLEEKPDQTLNLDPQPPVNGAEEVNRENVEPMPAEPERPAEIREKAANPTQQGETSPKKENNRAEEAMMWQANRSEVRPERERVVVERAGGGTALGLVVDQLSRRRDRKEKRERQKSIKQVNERLEQLEERQTPNEQLLGELRIPHPEIKIAQPAKLESLQTILSEKKEQLERVAAIEPAPEVILEKVVAAAEKNVPIEAVFERRHEVKDKDTARQQAARMAAGAFASQGSYDRGTQKLDAFADDISKQNLDSPLSKAALYKKAALSGFWTGLILFAILLAMIILG